MKKPSSGKSKDRNLSGEPICPCYVYDEYKLSKIKKKLYVVASNKTHHTYDLANETIRTNMLESFLQVKTPEACIAWTQKYSFLLDLYSPTVRMQFPVDAFLQAVASMKWIRDFSYAETVQDLPQLRKWLHHREDLGDNSCAIFSPEIDYESPKNSEILHFAGVCSDINANYAHIVNEEDIQLYSKERFFSFPFRPEFIEDTRRSMGGADFGENLMKGKTPRHNFQWHVDDNRLLRMAKEYLQNVFAVLMEDVGLSLPMLSVNGTYGLVSTPNLDSPWKAIKLAIYEKVVKSGLRKCQNPTCVNIGIDWPKHKHFCSDACRKMAERKGSTLKRQ